MSATFQARGHAALEERVTRAHEMWVAAGEHSFRSRGDVARLGDVLKFRWDMITTADGEVAGVGLEVFLLAPDGRIRLGYQFIES